MKHLSKPLFVFVLTLCGFCGVLPSNAQEFNEIQAVIKPQLQLEKSRQIRQLVQRIGRDRFKQQGSVSTSSSFGADLDPNEVDDAVSEEGGNTNLWLDLSTTRLEDTTPVRAYEGKQDSISFGFDTTINERLLLGLIGNVSESDVDNVFLPGNSTADVVSAGPYFAFFVTDTLVLTGSYLHSWTENGASSGGVVANYDSEGWVANATLTSYHLVGNALLAPSIGLSFDEERDESYTDSAATFFPASTIRNSVLAFGVSASTSVALSSGWVADPSVGIEGEWTFDSSVDAPTSVVANTEEFDANLVAGIDFQWNDTLSVEVSGTYSGLAKTNYESITGAVRITFSF